MTREEWDKLRAERPDLQLYKSSSVFEAATGFAEGMIGALTPEGLVNQITSEVLKGNVCHWARDPFWGIVGNYALGQSEYYGTWRWHGPGVTDIDPAVDQLLTRVYDQKKVEPSQTSAP